jgi:hypothetical protein
MHAIYCLRDIADRVTRGVITAQELASELRELGNKLSRETPEPPPEPTVNGHPLSHYMSPVPSRGWDTVLGYLAKNNPEALAIHYDHAEDTQRDGFWLTHKMKQKVAARGIRYRVWSCAAGGPRTTPLKVPAPAVLRERGIETVNAYPVCLLRERLG